MEIIKLICASSWIPADTSTWVCSGCLELVKDPPPQLPYSSPMPAGALAGTPRLPALDIGSIATVTFTDLLKG